MSHLSGNIAKVVFRNPENGYTVCAIESDGQEITVVGTLPQCEVGQSAELTGKFIKNQKFGEQFVIESAKILEPKTAQAIEKYLSSGLFPGIGAVTASRVVAMFGEESLNIIKNNPKKLATVQGISPKKATQINEAYLANSDMQEAVAYLVTLGISVNLSIKIFKIYGCATISTVKKNPYILIEEVDGIGFTRADSIAEGLGIARTSKFRLNAGIVHSLKQASNDGNTCLPQAKLLSLATSVLRLDEYEAEGLLSSAISDLEVTGKLVITGDMHSLAHHYITEKSIAVHLLGLKNASRTLSGDTGHELDFFEKTNNIALHSDQRTAVMGAVNNGVSIITGGPGTGKTTIIKATISLFLSRGLKIELCAPTGRASKRMSQACGQDAKTIHRLLELDFSGGVQTFTYNENQKLDADVVIVDEISMCDEYVFNALIKAIRRGARLVMVGDKDQLPSVGAGNVLSDLISSKIIPTFYLTQIYRQEEGSLIVTNAHRINSGKMPLLDNTSTDFFFLEKDSPQAVLETSLGLITTRLPKHLGINGKSIQVLCPMKKGVAGVENLCIALQNALNPPRGSSFEVVHGARIFRQGDKVIHTKNDYQLEWVKTEPNGTQSTGQGVFNGDIGIILSVDKPTSTIRVVFDDGKMVVYSHATLDMLQLAYAISIHKSQGSEFDVVVLPIIGGNFMIMTRNLLYTAVTRAKKMVVLVGEKSSIYAMVKNNYTEIRHTLLKDFLLGTTD